MYKICFLWKIHFQIAHSHLYSNFDLSVNPIMSFFPLMVVVVVIFNVCVCVHIYYMFCLYFCFLKAIMVQEVCQSHLNFFFLTNRYNTAQSMIAWTQRCRNVGSENRLYNYMWILHGVGLAPQPLIIIYCEIITIISLVNIHHTLHCYK